MHEQDKGFIHLHVHSEYSVLDGTAKIAALCRKAVEQGAPAIAVTDHGVMYGAYEFYKKAKEHQIKPIIGVEAYIAPTNRFDKSKRNEAHVTLLAQDEEGYKNLMKLVSIGFLEGYYYKPRIDMDVLEKYNAGIICLSGCLSGLVQEPLKTGNYLEAKKAAQAYKDIFGKRFYLELMRHGIKEQNFVEESMLKLQKELDVPLVATNDSHYIEHADNEFHDVMLCIQTKATLQAEKRFHFHGDQFYVKTPQEMREIFKDIPEACDTTLEIAKNIDITLENKGIFHIPQYPIPEEKQKDRHGSPMTPEKYLRKLCLGGLRKRYGEKRITAEPQLRERLEYELKAIEEMGFCSYFLMVWDFIKYARDNDIPVGPGRGSAVGSIVAYCLGITSLDPLKYGLYFERFWHPGRKGSMPDIDTDFCINGRKKVIQYVEEKYGTDHVARIVTFGTMEGRGAIRDAGRVMEIDKHLVDRLAKFIPNGAQTKLSIKEARKKVSDIIALETQYPELKRLLDMAERIEGYVRNEGTHAAAVLISDAPVTEYVPLCIGSNKNEETINTQYEMSWIEEIGLVKMDFLGLRTLTFMRAAEKEIQRTVNPKFDLAAIKDNDEKTFAMLARGETVGVFQLESDGMRSMLMKMKPDNLLDIVVAVSLYRPGPMKLIPDYIDGKHGMIEPSYLHPKLEPILAETYGIAVYQEQVMRVATDIAGYSLAEADNLRKVMGKKHKEKIAAERIKFVKSSEQNGVSSATAERIFNFIEPFAGYGFNKSHAVAYAWIAYQTAYLKANYPKQYFAALLTSIADKTDKLVEYINETRRRNIPVLPPDINLSMNDFAVVGDSIRFGFGAIKGIAQTSVENIIEEREKNGTFISLFELISRTRGKKVQRSAIEAMIKVGACESLEGHKAQHIEALDDAFRFADLEVAETLSNQMSMFGDLEQEFIKPKLNKTAHITKARTLTWEREGLGIYVSGHPTDDAKDTFKNRKMLNIQEAKKTENRNIVVGGMVAAIKRIVTKKDGKAMLVATIEDTTGSIEAVLFPSQYEENSNCFVEGAIVGIAGQIKTKERQASASERQDADMEMGIDEEKTHEESDIIIEKNLIISGVEELFPAGWEPTELLKETNSLKTHNSELSNTVNTVQKNTEDNLDSYIGTPELNFIKSKVEYIEEYEDENVLVFS